MRIMLPVELPELPGLTHADRIVSIGSCFAHSLGERLCRAGFQNFYDLWGTLYNPASITQGVLQALTPSPTEEIKKRCVKRDGAYCHLDYHGSIWGKSEEELLKQIRWINGELRSELTSCSWLIVTLGTAWVFSDPDGHIVANCHKQEGRIAFKRTLLSPEAVYEHLKLLMRSVRQVNPGVKVLLTVSPVRHLRDGAHENSVSKGVLHYAIHQLLGQHYEGVYYFPAYEIMMDELRDYRYYASDLVHPGEQGVEYIWERLSEVWLSEESREVARLAEKFNQLRDHQLLHPTPENEQRFEEELRRLQEHPLLIKNRVALY